MPLGTKSLGGRTIVVTAGPSREALDPVRYLSNHSSGKMGYALARAAAAAGARVVLISGPVALEPPEGVELVPFVSTAELRDRVIEVFPQSDCLIMAAAPADFRPAQVADAKIKRGKGELALKLEPTPDVLADVAARKGAEQVVVGFALETHDAIANARRKLGEKHLDLIVLNEVGAHTGFDSDTNRVTLLRPGVEPDTWPLLSKDEVAERLVDMISKLIASLDVGA